MAFISNKDIPAVRDGANPKAASDSCISEQYRAASRRVHSDDTVFSVNGVKIGGKNFTVIAGPCSVENGKQTLAVACAVKNSGAKLCGEALSSRAARHIPFRAWATGLQLLAEAGKQQACRL
jgi:3-deoxy-7-phosphoheptulonate synthase